MYVNFLFTGLPRPFLVHFLASLRVEISEMAISDKDFPSSKAFDVLEQMLQDEEMRKDMTESSKACFAFDLTSNEGKQVLHARART
jgi:hypothetical protein